MLTAGHAGHANTDMLLQTDPPGLSRFKSEWRKAQHLHSREERLLRHVIRSAFPPEASPHGVASNPPPSYSTPSHEHQQPKRHVGIHFGALDIPGENSFRPATPPGSAGANFRTTRYYPGRTFDWSERALNDSGSDYLMLRKQPALPAAPAPFSSRRSLSRAGSRRSSVTHVVMSEAPRPHTSGTNTRVRSRGASMAYSASPTFSAAAKYPSPPPSASTPRQVFDLRGFGRPAERTACIADHNPFISRARSPTYTGLSTLEPPDTGHSVAHDRSMHAGLQGTVDIPDGMQLVADCSKHLSDVAGSLRSYNTSDAAHRPPTAVSTVASTFARPPRAPHVSDASVASPCERIAANYSLHAWGLSPRTLRYFAPHGLSAAVGRSVKAHLCHTEPPPVAPVPDEEVLTSAARHRLDLLPLELFDDLEREARSGSEWVSLGDRTGGATPAMTRWLNLGTGEYEDRQVRVVDYDEGAAVFVVRFEKGGVEKRVKRLNLRFLAEDAAAHAARVAAAHALRAQLESSLRLHFYLQANDAEEPVDTYNFEKKVETVHQSCNRVPVSIFNRLRGSLVADFQENYCLAMRLACFRYHGMNPAMASTLRVLNLPERRFKGQAAPQSGVLPVVPMGEQRLVSIDAGVAWASQASSLAFAAVRTALQVRLCHHISALLQAEASKLSGYKDA
jgi:hypothetical protein